MIGYKIGGLFIVVTTVAYSLLQYLIGLKDFSPFGKACNASVTYSPWTTQIKFLEGACLTSMLIVYFFRSIYHGIWKEVFNAYIIVTEVVLISLTTCIIVLINDWGGICCDILEYGSLTIQKKLNLDFFF